MVNHSGGEYDHVTKGDRNLLITLRDVVLQVILENIIEIARLLLKGLRAENDAQEQEVLQVVLDLAIMLILALFEVGIEE